MKKELYSTLKDLLEKEKEIFDGEILSEIWSQYGIICFKTQREGKPAKIGFVGYELREANDKIINIVGKAVLKTNKGSVIPNLKGWSARLNGTKYALFMIPLSGKRKEDRWIENKFKKALKILYGNLMAVVVNLAVEKAEEVVSETYENHQITAGVARTKIANRLLEETIVKVGTIGDKVIGTPTFLVKRK